MVRRNECSGANRPSWAGSLHAVADLHRVGQPAREHADGTPAPGCPHEADTIVRDRISNP